MTKVREPSSVVEMAEMCRNANQRIVDTKVIDEEIRTRAKDVLANLSMAEEGWKNTTLRKDGLWYQWIEGFWSGHPAFGIKKAYHAPKMGDAA